MMAPSITTWPAVAGFVAAAASIGLAALVLAWTRASLFHRSLAASLGVVAVHQASTAMLLLEPVPGRSWLLVSLLAEVWLPVVLSYVTVQLMESTQGSAGMSARWRARVLAGLALALSGLAWVSGVATVVEDEQGETVLALGVLGRPLYVFVLLGFVVVLAQFEQLLRAMRDADRYRLKFIFIGLGSLGGLSIYQASRLLLVPVWKPDLAAVTGLAGVIAVGLIGFGLARTRLQEFRSRIFVSQQALFGSVTFMIVGLYLLGVGFIGELVRYTGLSGSRTVSAAVVFAAVVVLAIAAFSRRARAEIRRFLVRHFYRSRHDYRAKWMEATDAFRHAVSGDAILDQLLGVLSRTFGAGKISVWLRYEADGRYHQARSINTEPAPEPLEETHPLIRLLTVSDVPVDLETLGSHKRPRSGRVEQPGAQSWVLPFRGTTGASVCVPIRSQDQLMGFITLSPLSTRERYDADDCDLLRAMSHQAGVMLAHARLAEERHAAAELEALYRLSAFCLHDLKNLAGRLSLVAQNAETHGHDQDFQRAAMRTLSTTVRQMTGLISKLSFKRVGAASSAPADVFAVLEETLGVMNGALHRPITTHGDPVPPVQISRESLQQVLLNVILNAQQAANQGQPVEASPEAAIHIQVHHGHGRVVICVTDTGPGIPEDRLKTLFQPFCSTKSGGLGIGLYQCKQVVEAHRGTIRVESEVGKGTRVLIELPVAAAAARSKAGAGAAV